MRLHGKLVAVLLGLAALAAVNWQPWLSGFSSRRIVHDWRIEKARASTISVAYVLEKERWLRFSLPPLQKTIKVVTNADLPIVHRQTLPALLPPDPSWEYRLQFQVLDRADQVLLDQCYHHRAGLTEYYDPVTSATITAGFYLNEDLLPLDARVMMIPLADLAERAVTLRMRLLDVDENVSGVVVRIYHREARPEFKVHHLWQRTSSEKRQNLARGNVYQADLLSEQEKRNLVLRHWAALAPLGVQGRDYQQRDFYVLMDKEGEEVREPLPPAGVLIDAGSRGVIPVPEAGGKIRLVFRALPAQTVARSSAPLEIRWYGRVLSERTIQRVPWDGSTASVEAFFAAGLIEVQAPQALSVRAFLTEAAGAVGAEFEEITPEPIYVWSYLSSERKPVTFSILHLGGASTPFRIDLRRVLPLPGDEPIPASATVDYDFLDVRGHVVRRGALHADQPPSLYDRFSPMQRGVRTSDPTCCFFSVPADVVRVQLRSRNEPVVITAYNRPGDLVRFTRVPEDYYPYNRNDVLQRTWFLLRAERHDPLVLENRVPILWLQPRPHEDDPDMLAGRFQWHDHHPEGPWRGRFLLTPRDPQASFRSEALPVTYRELLVNQETSVSFQLLPGRRELAPTCLFLSDQIAVPVRIFVDGHLHHELTLTGTRGDLLLPSFPSKDTLTYSVRVVATQPVRIFINQNDPGTDAALVKRLAIQFESALLFDYEKASPDDEMLSLTLFRPHGTRERTQLRVQVETPSPSVGPHASWTFPERRFDVRSAEGALVPVLETKDHCADAGQVFFFTFGSDMPPGRYRIKLLKENGPGGYILLAKTIPGSYEQRELFFEPAKVTRSEP